MVEAIEDVRVCRVVEVECAVCAAHKVDVLVPCVILHRPGVPRPAVACAHRCICVWACRLVRVCVEEIPRRFDCTPNQYGAIWSLLLYSDVFHRALPLTLRTCQPKSSRPHLARTNSMLSRSSASTAPGRKVSQSFSSSLLSPIEACSSAATRLCVDDMVCA